MANPIRVTTKTIAEGEVVTNKYRWKELTYKLIYPAFFGNMVYDFFSFINEHSTYHWTKIAATLFILFFYVIDYVHLNVDLENLVPEQSKDGYYMAADIGVSLLLFLAVAFIKFGLPEVSVFLVCIVPMLFAAYNTKLNYHTNFHKVYRRVTIAFLILFGVVLWRFNDASYYSYIVNYFLLGTSVILTTWYFIYNKINFWVSHKKPQINEGEMITTR